VVKRFPCSTGLAKAEEERMKLTDHDDVLDPFTAEDLAELDTLSLDERAALRDAGEMLLDALLAPELAELAAICAANPHRYAAAA
jgi:hypothetical protein